MNRKAASSESTPATLPWELPRYRNWLAVARVHQIVRRQLGDAIEPLGIDLARLDILAALYREPGLAQRELAERLLTGRSNLTMLLPELERRRLIKRVPDPSDGRVRRVNLTAKGEALAQQGLARQGALVQHMFGALQDAECEALGDMMRRVGRYLEDEPFVGDTD